MSKKHTVTIPNEMSERLGKYNEGKLEFERINLSHLTQKALSEELQKVEG